MKIVIDIPKEFERDWKQDRFADSLNRVKADANLIAGDYEKETAEMLINAFDNAHELESCEDAISRQAAIDAMCCVCGNDCDKNKFVYNAPQDEQVIMCPEHYALSTLPSAEPERNEGEWIPFDPQNNSPEENKVVLLGVRNQDNFKYFVASRTDYNYWTGLGREIIGELRWQPLPEPYQEESEE